MSIKLDRLGHWSFLLSRFLAGQGVVQFLNLLTGFLILRYLPVSEYALYTVAAMLLSIGSVGSDMGISQGMVSIGARIRDDRQGLGSLYAASLGYRRWFFVVSAIVVMGVTPFAMRGHDWSVPAVLSSVVLVLVITWIQQAVSLKTALLNVFHDAHGLVNAGLVSASARLLLTLSWCRLLPTAASALAINLVGSAVSGVFLGRYCRMHVEPTAQPSPDHGQELRAFIIPLAPGIVYYLLQGQISTAILSFMGYTSSVAEIGALGRLGQILVLIMAVNSFFVQPHFSRINSRSEFVEKGLLVLGGMALLSAVVLVSAFVVPGWWLFILGGNYSGLRRELPVALLVPLLFLLSGTMYTMIIARRATGGQSWMIAAGLAVQFLFVGLHGVRTTLDALLLNMWLAGSAVVVQALLLSRTLVAWR